MKIETRTNTFMVGRTTSRAAISVYFTARNTKCAFDELHQVVSSATRTGGAGRRSHHPSGHRAAQRVDREPVNFNINHKAGDEACESRSNPLRWTPGLEDYPGWNLNTRGERRLGHVFENPCLGGGMTPAPSRRVGVRLGRRRAWSIEPRFSSGRSDSRL